MPHMDRLKTSVLLMVFVLLAACGTASNVVYEAPADKITFQSVNITELPPNVDVPADVQKKLLDSLHHELYEEKGFSKGNDLQLEYRIVSYTGGNRLKRFVAGGIGNWGEGDMVIQTKYKDVDGKIMGELTTRGKIGSGIFGGPIKSAARRVAEKIAMYTTTIRQ